MTGKRRKSKHSRRDVGKVEMVATATGGRGEGPTVPIATARGTVLMGEATETVAMSVMAKSPLAKRGDERQGLLSRQRIRMRPRGEMGRGCCRNC